jgi:hypothetical protein
MTKNGTSQRFFFLGTIVALLVLSQINLSYGDVRLAVAPFQMEPGQGKEIVRCRYCGNIMPGGTIQGDPSSVLTHVLWDFLKENGKGFDLISPGQVEGMYNIDLAKSFQKDPLAMMKSIGKQINADYLLWGTLSRYHERIGTSYGVQEPASVAFDLHLLRIKDGTLIWRVQYAKTQKSLSENLLDMENFLKQKMRWLTAEELSRLGLEQILRDFPSAESLK